MITILEAKPSGQFGRGRLIPNVGAGCIVAVVALPLPMAFAIASGARPQQGISTAIIGGLMVSLLGGSRAQIAGPTSAFIAILAGVADGMTGTNHDPNQELIGQGLANIVAPLFGGFAATGTEYPARRAGGHPVRGGLQHERDSALSSLSAAGARGRRTDPRHHFCAHGVRRSGGGCHRGGDTGYSAIPDVRTRSIHLLLFTPYL